VHKCSHAFSSRFTVVVSSMPFCDEVASNKSLGYLTMRVPFGVCNGALVACGAARRDLAGVRRGLAFSVRAIALTADGVGVIGGGPIGESVSISMRRRLLRGVCGTSGTLNVLSSDVAADLFFARFTVLENY
jgi:hypothetical protein